MRSLAAILALILAGAIPLAKPLHAQEGRGNDVSGVQPAIHDHQNAPYASIHPSTVYPQDFFEDLKIEGFKLGLSPDDVKTLLSRNGYTITGEYGSSYTSIGCQSRKFITTVNASDSSTGRAVIFHFGPPDLLGKQQLWQFRHSVPIAVSSLQQEWQKALAKYGPSTFSFANDRGFVLNYSNIPYTQNFVPDFQAAGIVFRINVSKSRQTNALSIDILLYSSSMGNHLQKVYRAANPKIEHANKLLRRFNFCP